MSEYQQPDPNEQSVATIKKPEFVNNDLFIPQTHDTLIESELFKILEDFESVSTTDDSHHLHETKLKIFNLFLEGLMPRQIMEKFPPGTVTLNQIRNIKLIIPDSKNQVLDDQVKSLLETGKDMESIMHELVIERSTFFRSKKRIKLRELGITNREKKLQEVTVLKMQKAKSKIF